MEINIPGVVVKSKAEANRRFSALLWGQAGCGKTVLAATAPGHKIWLLFDPDGDASLGLADDITVLDFTGEKHGIVQKFDNDDPLQLSKYLDTTEEITLVVDSTTAYRQLALERGISLTKGATLERPSPGAYGARGTITLRMMTALLRLTSKYNQNIIFTAHEDEAEKDDDGNVVQISMMLGGKLTGAAALQISEVWHLTDTGKERRIMVRPGRMRKPMKTRMFLTDKGFEFAWKYDQNNPLTPVSQAATIAAWMKQWKDNGYEKIALPS